MSFRCDLTGKQSRAGEKEIRIVSETRDVVYYDDRDNPIGSGRNIVKELRLSVDGLRVWVDGNPQDTESAERLDRLTRPSVPPVPRGVGPIGMQRGGKPEFMQSGCFSAYKGLMG